MKKGIVSTGSKEATQAGIEILHVGGNAFDAAIAAVFTSMTSEYILTGAGGGGAMMCHRKGNPPIIYDFFVDTPPNIDGKELDFFNVNVDFGDSIQKFNIGKGSVAIPGTLLGLVTIHRQYGSLPLSIILEPAIELAKIGSIINSQQAYVFKLVEPILSHTLQGKDLFYKNNKILKEGDTFKNLDFSIFLERVAKEGVNFFYEGDGAELLSNFFLDGGLISMKSLKKYQVSVRPPVHTVFRDIDFFSNPAPSLGGTLIVFMLNLLDNCTKKDINFNQLLNAMLITDIARKRVFLDPNQEYQINKLLEDEIFIKYLKKYFNEENYKNLDFERGCTTHVSVIDKDLSSASITTTNGEGCGYIVPGTGIMMNNMLGEADLNPFGFHNFKHSMRLPTMISPSILIRDGMPLMIFGSGGSNRIRSAIVQVMINFLTKGMSLNESIIAPRFHLEGKHILFEPGIDIDYGSFINNFSIHPFESKNLFFGGVNAVTPYEGFSDSRRGGVCQII